MIETNQGQSKKWKRVATGLCIMTMEALIKSFFSALTSMQQLHNYSLWDSHHAEQITGVEFHKSGDLKLNNNLKKEQNEINQRYS